jgi:hypothetical protein
MDTISTRYIQLAYALERHVPGFVDAYTGPPALREHAPELEPAALADALATLRETVQQADLPPERRALLAVQLRGMHTTARKLAGESISYRDEVRACFDIEPVQTPEAVFEAANAELDGLLPGAGTLAERSVAWRKRFEVSPDVARQMIDQIMVEARERTAALVALPDPDEVRVELVHDKPWSGYNWYLGGGRSLVEINTDLPIRANALLDLVCHEAYPGHHTEHGLKEQLLYRERGWGEFAIQLINVPECVISEGIATLAAEMIFGAEAYVWAAEQIYPLGGITGDPEREQRIAAAQWNLRALSGNAALLLHEQGVSEEDVVRYIMRYGLRSETEARQSLRFIATPLWRIYVFTYFAGRELLGRWINAGDRHERFRTLLREPVTPMAISTGAWG